MRSDEDLSFINGLSAALAGVSDDEYVEAHEKLIGMKDDLQRQADAAQVTSFVEYKSALNLKGVLSSVVCYTFNSGMGRDRESFSAIERVIDRKLYSFCIRQRAHGHLNSLLKYLLWSRYFYDECREKIIADLMENNLLFRRGDGYVITGLHLAEGDNVFGVSRDGREYRRYVKTVALQCFPIKKRWQELLKERCIEPQTIDESLYHLVFIGDRKYEAKISFTARDRTRVRERYCDSLFRRAA